MSSSFCLSGRQLESLRRTGGAAAAVIKHSLRLDSKPRDVLQAEVAAGSETPAQSTLLCSRRYLPTAISMSGKTNQLLSNSIAKHVGMVILLGKDPYLYKLLLQIQGARVAGS